MDTAPAARADKEGKRDMSNEIYLQCVGEGGRFKRTLFEEIMSKGAVNPQFPLVDVAYPDGSGANEIYADESEDLDGVSFGRFGGSMFYDRLWELADRTNSYVWWPDLGSPIAVTREDMISQLPEDLLDGEEEPYVVRSGKELEQAVGDDLEEDDENEEE
jgi:hypothetical protein